MEGGRGLLSQTKLRFCENPNRKADREPGILLDQGFGPKAGCDRPPVDVLVICDRSEVAQRIAEAHQPFEVAGVLAGDQIAILAALQRVPEGDPRRQVLHHQAGVEKGGEQAFDEGLAEKDGGGEVAVDKRRARLCPGVERRRPTEKHGPLRTERAAEVREMAEPGDLSGQIVMQIGEQMADRIEIGDAGKEIGMRTAALIVRDHVSPRAGMSPLTIETEAREECGIPRLGVLQELGEWNDFDERFRVVGIAEHALIIGCRLKR